MSNIINDLFNQNEQLIELMGEIEQSANCKTRQLHEFMLNTASKSIDYGMALSAYEIEMKKLTEHNLPSIFHYDEMLNKSELLIDYYAKENQELKQENKNFFNDIQLINAELMYYKNVVYNLMFSTNNNLNWHMEKYYLIDYSL